MRAEAKRNLRDMIVILINFIMLIVTCLFLSDLPKIVRISTVLLFLFLCVLIPAINNKTAIRVLIFSSVTLSLVVISYIFLEKTGLIYDLKDFEKLKSVILESKQWGVLIFLAITVFQVVVLPIPSAVTIMIGVAIYGPLWSFVLSTVGTYIGSLISFYLGRTFGKKLVVWMFGEDKTLKYAEFLNKKGRGMFVLMLLFPFFPDDLLCMLAGITTMPSKFFFLAMLLTRPIIIGLTAFLGSGEIIPFRGWGIPVWGAILALSIISLILITRLKNKIQKRGSATRAVPATNSEAASDSETAVETNSRTRSK